MGTLKIHKLKKTSVKLTQKLGKFYWSVEFIFYNGSTLSLVDQQSVGSSHINKITDGHVLQVLGHFTSFRKLGVDILEVHLLKPFHQFLLSNYQLSFCSFNVFSN